MYNQSQWDAFIISQTKIRKERQEKDFQNWVKTNDNEMKLFSLLNIINKAIETSPYELKNKNAFKDELATFIYNLTIDA